MIIDDAPGPRFPDFSFAKLFYRSRAHLVLAVPAHSVCVSVCVHSFFLNSLPVLFGTLFSAGPAAVSLAANADLDGRASEISAPLEKGAG